MPKIKETFREQMSWYAEGVAQQKKYQRRCKVVLALLEEFSTEDLELLLGDERVIDVREAISEAIKEATKDPWPK